MSKERERFELSSIAKESIPRALEKAERYRLLNEPFFAESICLDILEIEADNHAALVTYILSLADQFTGGGRDGMSAARGAIAKLPDEYERLYYEGIVFERRGHAALERGGPGSSDLAWEYLEDAIELYDKAIELRPGATHDDAVLRRNTCIRLIRAHRLSPPSRERSEYPLE